MGWAWACKQILLKNSIKNGLSPPNYDWNIAAQSFIFYKNNFHEKNKKVVGKVYQKFEKATQNRPEKHEQNQNSKSQAYTASADELLVKWQVHPFS